MHCYTCTQGEALWSCLSSFTITADSDSHSGKRPGSSAEPHVMLHCTGSGRAQGSRQIQLRRQRAPTLPSPTSPPGAALDSNSRYRNLVAVEMKPFSYEGASHRCCTIAMDIKIMPAPSLPYAHYTQSTLFNTSHSSTCSLTLEHYSFIRSFVPSIIHSSSAPRCVLL